MKEIFYQKLVRDNIPELIKEQKEIPVTKILKDRDYWQALKNKLQEEVTEFNKDETLEELVDILEVIYALTKVKGYSLCALEECREKKAQEKGTFVKRIYLEKKLIQP